MARILLAYLMAAALQPPGQAAAQTAAFEPTRITRAASVRFEATPEELFALLSPEGQQSLTSSWDIAILSPPSGAVEPGATFTKTHRRAPVQQVWMVVSAEAPRRLSYAIFVAGLETWLFEMELQTLADGNTSVDVAHTITSLSPEANAAVQEFADTFDSYVATWSAAIQRGLASARQR